MQLTSSTVVLSLLITLASAGPIRRKPDVVRRSNAIPKRYVVGPGLDPITFGLPRRAAATGAGTEQGSVPAVGVGGGNTSLLSLLSSTASVTQSAVAAAPTTTPNSSSNTNTPPTSPSLTRSATSSSGTGNESGKVPAVGVGNGNTSLLGLLTTSIASASTGGGAAPSGPPQAATSILPIPASGASQTGSINSATSPQDQPGAATTTRIMTTIMTTVQVTATESPPAVSASAQPVTPSVTVVFVTESPTFSGAVGGYSTLAPNAGQAGQSSFIATSSAAPEVTTSQTLSASADLSSIATISLQPTVTNTESHHRHHTHSDKGGAGSTNAPTPAAPSVTSAPLTVIPVSNALGQLTVTVTTTVTAG